MNNDATQFEFFTHSLRTPRGFSESDGPKAKKYIQVPQGIKLPSMAQEAHINKIENSYKKRIFR